VPVHSTAFRPVQPAALQINFFCVLASLLRLELIEDAELRQLVEKVLNERCIFTLCRLTAHPPATTERPRF